MRLIRCDVLKPKILEYVKALERIKYCYGYDTFGKYYNGKKSAYLNAANLIDEAPTVEERKRGHWIELEPDKYGNFIQCSVCDSKFGLYSKDNYCQACGAIMDGEAGGV